MRSIVIIMFFIFSACASHNGMHIDDGNDYRRTYKWQSAAVGAGLSMVSGACWGMHETVVHHPNSIPAGWNRRFWDNRYSWRNKYAGGDPTAGAKYFGSTTILAWTTDAKHLFATAHRATLFGSAVVITIGQPRPVWHYMIDAGISFAAFTAGFHSVYSLALR